MTQAAFLREVAAQYHTEQKKLQSSQLSTFRSNKGPLSGNTSAIFYGAYVYFEKLRIKEKKPKSNKRLEMEEVHWISGGLDTKRRREKVVCRPCDVPYLDSLGTVRIAGQS